MRVGFHVTYQKCDATLLALRTARHFRDMGYAVEILPRGSAVPVQPAWDRHALANRDARFPLWVKQKYLTHVIWTEPPQRSEIALARKAGAVPLLLVSWDRLTREELSVCKLFHKLLCPSWLATTLLHDKLGMTNVLYVPWDVGVPFSLNSHPPTESSIKLFWPLWGSQARRQEPAVLGPLQEVLAAYPHVSLTVSTSGGVPRDFLRGLEKASRRFTGRLDFLRAANIDKHILAVGRHDLTVWPTLVESAGLAGLHSLSMGVPVLAFDYPLNAEFLRDGKNALLVPSEVRYNSLGVPHVDPDYAKFGRYLADAVTNPRHLLVMRQRVLQGMRDRREQFSKAWETVMLD